MRIVCSIVGWMLSGVLFAQTLPQFDIKVLQQSVDGRYARLFAQDQLKDRASTIELAGLVLDGVASGYAPQKMATALRALNGLQDKSRSSATYGNVHWYNGDTKLVDKNGVEFVTRKAALLWLLYADKLTPAQREPLQALLELAKTGITRHEVRISYTNIYLMKTWNLIALGEGMNDAALAEQGYTQLRDWLRYTARTGINEYLSPSYYDVDLESLALIANLSRNAAARQMARDGLDYFWHEIALNWYLPADRLGGPHSRDYNRLFNVGGLNKWVARAGWTGSAAQPADKGPYETFAWAPPPAAAAQWVQPAAFPRTVQARWGEEAEKRYTHYLGKHFSIGSANAGYQAGHDNAPLVINLGGGQDVPIINFFMDGRRDYYGLNKTLEAGSGHMKALHLRPFLSSVQRGNEVLFMASVRDSSPDSVALESVITLPADAQYWLDDQRLDIFTARSQWQYDYAPNQQTTFIDIQKRDGQPEVVLSDKDSKAGVGISRSVPVLAGQKYRLSASLQGGDIYLYLNFYDASGRLIGSEHAEKVRGGSTAFAERSFSQVAPVGAVRCKAWLYSTSANQTSVRLRDLRFEALEATGAKVLAGFDFQPHQAQAIAVAAGKTLFARRGDAVAALRLLGAWDVNDEPVGFVLHNDGLANNALRLTATHSHERSYRRVSTAVWAQATEGIQTDADFAAYRKQILARKTSASLQGDLLKVEAGVLKLENIVESGKRLLREGMDTPPDNAVLVVDGRDVGKTLLGKYLE